MTLVLAQDNFILKGETARTQRTITGSRYIYIYFFFPPFHKGIPGNPNHRAPNHQPKPLNDQGYTVIHICSHPKGSDCKGILPKMAETFRLRIYFINCPDIEPISSMYGILCLPTFGLFLMVKYCCRVGTYTIRGW